jgi:hypothetical protein
MREAMMKVRILLVLIVLFSVLQAQERGSLEELSAPQFTNPFYESFSRNYLGAEAAGRGYTGAAVPGNASGALVNPAVMMPDSAHVFTELNIKPSQDEVNLPLNSNYTSPMPLGLFGINARIGSRLAIAGMYSNPKSINLQAFSIEINQGAWWVERFPKYYLHQISAMASYKAMENLSLGLSLHNQIHYLDDVIFLRTYDRIERSEYALRIQPGVFWQTGEFGLGASATIPSNIDWDLHYARYDTVLPLELNAGVSYTKDSYRLSADMAFINDSAISDEFSDRYSAHLGVEKRDGNRILRAGYMFRSNVWDGDLMLPVNTSAEADSSMFWDDVATSLPIKDNSQHFLSVGIGFFFKHGLINLSAMQCIVGENPQTQINLGIALKLSTFRRKEIVSY